MGKKKNMNSGNNVRGTSKRLLRKKESLKKKIGESLDNLSNHIHLSNGILDRGSDRKYEVLIRDYNLEVRKIKKFNKGVIEDYRIDLATYSDRYSGLMDPIEKRNRGYVERMKKEILGELSESQLRRKHWSFKEEGLTAVVVKDPGPLR